MKRILPILFMLFHTALAGEASPPDRLHLRDGGVLPGTLLSVKAPEISWRTAAGESTWSLAAVRQITLGKSTDKDSHSTISLRAGDVLPAENIVLKNGECHFRSPWKKEASLPVGALTTIKLQPVIKPLYEGPKSEKEWPSSGNRSWTYKDGMLHSGKQYSRVRRQSKAWPAMVRMAFDLAMEKSGSMNVNIHRSSSTRGQAGLRYLSLQFSPSHAYLHVQFQNGVNFSRSLNHDFPTDGQPHRVVLSLHLQRGYVRLRVDGNELFNHQGQKNVLPYKASKHYVSFYGRSEGITVSRIRILPLSAWDGATQQTYPLPAGKSCLHLEGGEQIYGTLKALDKESVRIHSALGELAISRKSLHTIALSTKAKATPLENKGAEVVFTAGGRLQLTALTVEKDNLQGTHAIFGEIRLKLNQCKAIHWR